MPAVFFFNPKKNYLKKIYNIFLQPRTTKHTNKLINGETLGNLGRVGGGRGVGKMERFRAGTGLLGLLGLLGFLVPWFKDPKSRKQ